MKRRAGSPSQQPLGAGPVPPPPPPKSLSPKKGETITLNELAEWQHDNEFILSGYRGELGSYLRCYHSVYGFFHNETVNIWTHLVGSITALCMLAFTVSYVSASRVSNELPRGIWAPFSVVYPLPSPAQPSVTWKRDTLGFAIFFVGVATCLGFSSTFHTLAAHSQSVAHYWNRLDYIGIVVLISSTFVPLVSYGFFCHPHLKALYLCILAACATGTIAVVVHPKSRTPTMRRFRTWVFIALGLSAVFPVGHAIQRYGFKAAREAMALDWVILGGVLYILGAVLYAERCPERFTPGTFDYVGASHQIFHVLILLAAWAHYCAIAESFRFWHGTERGVCNANVYK